MRSYVLDFQEIDRTHLALVGGKGAHLGELSTMVGIRVPEGFCITTDAFRDVLAATPSVPPLLAQLARLNVDDRAQIAALSGAVRQALETAPLPAGLREEVGRHLARLGAAHAYAVRSSATAEDLPTASFAGQQDTYLNLVGAETILRHVSRCWASLFTERAVAYRLQHGFDHRHVHQAVVIQKMVFPQASGVLFTADPVTSHRRVVSIEACFGLGEALVSGQAAADRYRVRHEAVIDRKIATKPWALYASPTGGTEPRAIAPEQQQRPVLTDAQLLALARIGQHVETHFGAPQDIEWCWAEDEFYLVQSRPITTLYPLPEAPEAKGPRVYLSVGHQQMMTDPMRPLGWSMWQMLASRPMYQAGGRLFVEVADTLASPTGRNLLLHAMGQHDPLIKDALVTLLKREEFIGSLPASSAAPPSALDPPLVADEPPVALVTELMARSKAELAALQQTIRTRSGEAVVACIEEDIRQMRQSTTVAQTLRLVMTAVNAAAWLNTHLEEWLGEKNAADALSQSVPNNITSEMGLALLDVADVLRPYPELVAYLQHTTEEDFLEQLDRFEGGAEARDAIRAYLDRYGMRCSGEIDITRTRWAEKPTLLLPMLLNNLKNVAPGAGKLKFEQGRQHALRTERDILARLKQLPEGTYKAEATQRHIALLRNFAGYREYPKYSIVSRTFVYRQALLREADRLVEAGVIPHREDVYFLTFEEFRDAVRTRIVDARLIDQRKEEHCRHAQLTPPRVMTSDGEIVTGTYPREHLPADALVGLAVSSGTVEGRARVITHLAEAELEEGDILVTTFTDPSWTPLFVSLKGLVTEVGGLMTHGAVIAREYGLPAVVGVENATRLIRDQQRIRVNGTDGYVELL
ncbi:pyruvate, water dikinase [Catalinimonas alkaloidigena]|uniref:Prodigiosin synthesizing transferase PigC n=1 Tax=Catalinimonas alkaloidigena TaxID=1075417 RepID=A0A1G9ACG6_9BACT|nr:rifamycin-inactivating phosphotransferase [Catalinimonas alkaloidigena]SDK24923.1 pyruvate, water dikinase [Catalinimonas alkaloidigena]